MQNNHSPFPTGQNYLDFELEIGPGSAREYPVAVIRSPAGEARETMRFPFDELALDNRLKDLQIALLRSGGKRRQIRSPEEQAVQEFGRTLFDSLVLGEVRSRYDVSQREAARQGKGLRFKLRIQSPEMAALPWEFLYDARQAEYVCLSRNTPVVRYLELPQPIPPLTVAPPPRILGMIASPSDLPPLDVSREKQRVEQATQALQQNGLVELTWLEGQTWRDLQRAMRSGPWHVFHFIGHGGFDRQTDEGLIAVSNEEGQARNLTATQLGRLLADHRSLRLVLLNACEGARGSHRDIFSSTASILVRRGIPAVLAMQYGITDTAAIEFSHAFYEALADKWPVDAAVTEGRIAISISVTNTVEWGTPVLYMRSPDGDLFDIAVTVTREKEAKRPTILVARKVAAKPSTEKKTGTLAGNFPLTGDSYIGQGPASKFPSIFRSQPQSKLEKGVDGTWHLTPNPFYQSARGFPLTGYSNIGQRPASKFPSTVPTQPRWKLEKGPDGIWRPVLDPLYQSAGNFLLTGYSNIGQ